ncbi:MAG: adenylate/guanylate cyclase domain-containing protein [Pseudomonadota bacterium]
MQDRAQSEAELARWMLAEGTKIELPAFMTGLAQRLVSLGFPVDRFSVGLGLLNPSLLAASIIWRPNWPLEYTRYPYESRDSGLYERSPFKRAQDTQDWVHIDVARTPDSEFGIVPDLREQGITHYYAAPMPTSNGDPVSLTIATKGQRNFSDDEISLLKAVMPTLSAVVEIKKLHFTFEQVLGAYVGQNPAKQIIEGTVHRGEVTHLRAAIFVADLRGFTHLSTQLPPQNTADVINRYYDLVVPKIAERSGEVLKFIGDAVLAIFPTGDRGDSAAVLSALDAARAAFDTPREPYVVDGRTVDIRFGIAVHLGDAVFGNVGSGDRLDFTVIGRDVNVAARVASLCSRLGRDYLVSEEVAKIGLAAGRTMTEAGSHEVRGLAEPLKVFVPDTFDIGPARDDGISQGLLLAPTL